MQGTMETAASQLLSLAFLLNSSSSTAAAASSSSSSAAAAAAAGTAAEFRSDYLVVETVLPLALAPPLPVAVAPHACGGGGGAGIQGSLTSGGGAAYLGRVLLEMCKLDKRACDPIAVAVEVGLVKFG
jgi:hypothetical protein